MPDEPPFIDPVDDCPRLPARELFRQLGFVPPPPAAVDDFQLRGRLWEFIYALAGRRFWLSHTNHLSDRELYTWLHDVWFDEETADIPPEAEWNTRIDVTGGESDRGLLPVTWLRYYASEKDRAQALLDYFGETLPPQEDPPHDRDRWLPEPFYPPTASDFGDDLFPSEEDIGDNPADRARTEDDPLGLEAVDAAIEADQRRERKNREQEEETPAGAKDREQLAALTGGESAGWQRPIDQLRQTVTLLPPDELTGDTLHAKLWELLHNLACTGFYVLCTNHLDDRALYAEFWQHGLREEALLPGKIKTGGWYHDCVGSGSEEDTELWLRFHASDETRARWLRDWPDQPLPPKEPPPFNRD